VFPAVETAAQKGTAVVNRASRWTEVHTFAVCLGGKEKDRITGLGVFGDTDLVGFEIIALRRMQEERLLAPATFGATVAGNFRPAVHRTASGIGCAA